MGSEAFAQKRTKGTKSGFTIDPGPFYRRQQRKQRKGEKRLRRGPYTMISRMKSPVLCFLRVLL
jgi:hypothetical protein